MTAETAQQAVRKNPATSTGVDPVRIDPDLGFIRSLGLQAGTSFKKCFQCATCSATCALSPEVAPFPRKEMAWASWGMRDRLLADADVWLCHQCNDCSTRCPRGGRPGDVLAAVRRECILHHAFPGFLARWVAQARFFPLLLGLPAALLTAAIVLQEPLGEALGIVPAIGEGIVYAHTRLLPHWLLNGLFLTVAVLVAVVSSVGVTRYWRTLQRGAVGRGAGAPVMRLRRAITAVLGEVLTHRRFTECTSAKPRYVSHLCVFFGFVALCVVTLWVITAQINPLARGDFIYPFGFWSPWKLLANLGGTALLFGCSWMWVERLRSPEGVATGSYYDWALLGNLLLVVCTGFATEVLHYLRLEPHRHFIYYTHLVLVLALIGYLPYSKLAHLLYRTTAMVHATYTGRDRAAGSGRQPDRPEITPGGDDDVATAEA